MDLESTLFKLRTIIAKLNSLNVCGLITQQSYRRLVSALQDSGAEPDFLRELQVAEGLFDVQAPQACSECHRTDLRPVDLGALCAHKAICSTCCEAGRKCADCGQCLLCKKHCAEFISSGKAVHSQCFSTYVEANSEYLSQLADYLHLTDNEMLLLLQRRQDLLENYKRQAGLIVAYECESTQQRGEIDISCDIPPSTDVYCTHCGYYFSERQHTGMSIAQYQLLRTAVQNCVAVGLQVAQCPYCFAPCDGTIERCRCPWCGQVLLTCCSCKEPPVTAHGNAYHRPDCENFRQVETRPAVRCPECPQFGVHLSPTRLRTPRRFTMDEIILSLSR